MAAISRRTKPAFAPTSTHDESACSQNLRSNDICSISRLSRACIGDIRCCRYVLTYLPKPARIAASRAARLSWVLRPKEASEKSATLNGGAEGTVMRTLLALETGAGDLE